MYLNFQKPVFIKIYFNTFRKFLKTLKKYKILVKIKKIGQRLINSLIINHRIVKAYTLFILFSFSFNTYNIYYIFNYLCRSAI